MIYTIDARVPVSHKAGVINPNIPIIIRIVSFIVISSFHPELRAFKI